MSFGRCPGWMLRGLLDDRRGDVVNDLEQAVIVAARKANEYDRSLYGNPVDGTAHKTTIRLDEAIAALDESLKPDPWQILQDLYREFGFSISIDHSTPTGPELLDRVMKALEWRRNNGE